MRRPWIALLAAPLLFAPIACFADNIRGPVRAEVRLTSDAQFEQTVELRHQEYVAVYLPEDTTFLQGVQLELTLSAESRRYFDNFGFVVYDRLDGRPATGFAALTGRKAFLHGLLALNRLFYVISFGRKGALEVDLAQGIFRLPEPRALSDFPLLVGVVPIMKGVPDAMQSLVFYLKCRPLLRDAGAAILKVVPPASSRTAEFTVLVDDGPVAASSPRVPGESWVGRVELPSGLHSLRVSSPTLQPSETTFSIEPGKTTSVVVELRVVVGTVSIEAPKGSTIYIDGTKLDYPRESRVRLSEGEHVLRYKLDDYSGTRTFTVAEGKSYTIYVELNIVVKED